MVQTFNILENGQRCFVFSDNNEIEIYFYPDQIFRHEFDCGRFEMNIANLVASLHKKETKISNSVGGMQFYHYNQKDQHALNKAWTEFKAWVLIKTGLDIEDHRPVWAN